MILSRRNFLRGGVVTGGIAATAFATGSFNFTTDDIRLEVIDLRFPDLPDAFNGYSIGFLTDIHLGRWVPHEWVSQALKLIFDNKPDILLLGGDYLWVPDRISPIAELFVRNEKFSGLSPAEAPTKIYEAIVDLIKPWRPPDGIIGVLGNHDYWVDPDGCQKSLGDLGCRILVNSTSVIKRGDSELLIYGADDYLTGIPKLATTYPQDKKKRVSVLLTHNPDYLPWALSSNVFPFDLALCGHTHGGQINLQGIGALTYHIEDRRFGSGLVDLGGRYTYTSRGLGVVEFPVRINCPAEATVIRLIKA